MKISQPHL